MSTTVNFERGWQYKINGQVKALMEDLGQRIETDAKVLCAEDSGRLSRSIEHEVRGNMIDNYVLRVGTNVNYGIYVEMGTRPHLIRAKNKRFLRWVDQLGTQHFAREVHHPGTQAQPYLRPALYRQRGR